MATDDRKSAILQDVERNDDDSSFVNPPTGFIKDPAVDSDDDSGIIQKIPEKSLSWTEAAALLLLEYVVLAILSFPSSFAVLGMAGGLIATFFVGLITLYTTHVLWQYCMRYPATRDICDVAYNLTGGGKAGRIAWWAAFVGLALNNLCIMGLHSVAGSVALNTISKGAVCTQVFAIVVTLAMFSGSLFRDLKNMSALGLVAAVTMFIALLLCMIFSGVQDHPAGYKAGVPPTIRAWAAPGTTFVQGVNAVLNITYTFVGQIMIPSFIADMRNPAEFPKALYVSMAAELVLFSLGGAIIYWQVGGEYVTSPAYGSLQPTYSKIVAGWVLPTIVIIGCVYSLVTARVIFFQFFSAGSVHRRQHTTKGWLSWIGIVTALWIIAYIIGQAVPFFNGLLSLISALFDSWFGFLFWGAAYFEINRGRWFHTKRAGLESALNVVILIAGLFFLGAGTYTSVQSILDSYDTGNVSE